MALVKRVGAVRVMCIAALHLFSEKKSIGIAGRDLGLLGLPGRSSLLAALLLDC